jgi:hypothetical protein
VRRINVWRALQGTAAATIAWALAQQVGGGHHPFFAPIAAFIALNAPLGERGQNAVRLVIGVFLGIAVGEATVAIFGGYGGMAVATFTAASAAAALGGSRIMIAQAASSAILVVAVAAEPGIYRALDALIGAGVALVFSQALFSPQPLALLRRAEEVALAGVADGLELTSHALEHDDDDEARRAVDRLRELRDHLAELSRVRGASSRVARRSAVWRSQRAPVVRESESAGHLDLLAGSSLSFARAALGASAAARAWLAPSAGELAAALSDLAQQPGDRAVRQRAADRALEVARRLETAHEAPDPSLLAAVATGRMVAADVMAFAGVDPDQVAAALREDSDDIDVATPPPMPKQPFGLPARGRTKGGLLPAVRRLAGALRRRLRTGT